MSTFTNSHIYSCDNIYKIVMAVEDLNDCNKFSKKSKEKPEK